MLELKKMTAADSQNFFDGLAQLYHDNVKAHGYTDGFTLKDAREKISELTSYLERDLAIAYGCFDVDQIIGFIWAYPFSFREEKRIYVSVVQVNEHYRNQGIGEHMLQAVEEDAEKLGFSVLYIHTEASNTGAIRLYERMGYVLERVQMRKQINRHT